MKKTWILMATLCTMAFSNECDKNIDRISKEIEYAKIHNNIAKKSTLELVLKEVQNNCKKDPLFYDKKLEAKKLKEQEVEKIEKELHALEEKKDYMSKVEYKVKKKALKEQKHQIKKEIEDYIDHL
ncbi:DUF1090 family protein [Campylobacter sp. 2018MI35]|uniref:DUF1090 family protein n=1 Tax=Campylobacter molothri TaxID=1032242 RepID=UPI001904487D|nr:DUF1090 family protein [Campylobacter sp. 2018MI35]MBK2000379.1 DUF1090 family protein [Campylobacter sp. 2018MI35]MBZ7931714.1 DUF1090 family protein [Campylobacter sp. RM12910]